MTVERTINGYWRISTIKNNYLITRLFIGYTKREAITEFNNYLKSK